MTRLLLAVVLALPSSATAQATPWSVRAAYVKASIDSLVRPDGRIATYAASEHSLDQINEGRVLLSLFDRTHDPRYARAADMLREQLQPWADSATGLSRSFWGRAIGWYVMAGVDVLDHLPATHRDRADLVRIIQELADAVARVQDPASGVWWQVLDQPNARGNYLEASASAMFSYAFAKGARLGVLDPSYRALAARAFDGMLAKFVTVDDSGLVSLSGICKSAGLGGDPPRDGSYAYYVSEPVVSNDYQGVGAFILAAAELGR